MSDDICYCIVEFDFCSKKYFSIWRSDDVDYFLTENNELIIFDSFLSASQYCKNHGIQEPSLVVYDFNFFNYKMCEDFLNKWNIVEDLSNSVDMDFIGNHEDFTSLYSKFVYGSNIPALNTSGKKYVPTFSDEEIKKIETVQKDMERVFKTMLKIQDPL